MRVRVRVRSILELAFSGGSRSNQFSAEHAWMFSPSMHLVRVRVRVCVRVRVTNPSRNPNPNPNPYPDPDPNPNPNALERRRVLAEARGPPEARGQPARHLVIRLAHLVRVRVRVRVRVVRVRVMVTVRVRIRVRVRVSVRVIGVPHREHELVAPRGELLGGGVVGKGLDRGGEVPRRAVGLAARALVVRAPRAWLGFGLGLGLAGPNPDPNPNPNPIPNP